MSIRTRVIIVILIIGLGIAATKILVLTKARPEQRSQTSQGQLVQVMKAINSTVTMKVEGFGTVRAKTDLTETAEVSGKISFVSPNLQEGRFFKKEDLLMEIDPRTYELRVKQINAKIEQHKADLLRIDQRKENAKKNLEITAEEMEVATREWERQKGLRETKVASDASVDAARIKYLQTKVKKQAIENTLAELKPQKAMAEAQLNSAKVELEDAELYLSKTHIFAPFDGRTSKRLVEKGQFVTVGTPLAEIYDTSVVEVTVHIPLEDMPWLDLSGPLQALKENADDTNISMEDFPLANAHLEHGVQNLTWEGHVSRVAGIVEEATRTVPVIVEFPDPWRSYDPGVTTPLVPGMFVQVEIVGRQFDNVFEIPRSAVRPNDTVYIAERGLLRIRPIHVLRTIGNTAYVDKGIEPGELIIISPVSAITEGMKIRTPKEKVNTQ